MIMLPNCEQLLVLRHSSNTMRIIESLFILLIMFRDFSAKYEIRLLIIPRF